MPHTQHSSPPPPPKEMGSGAANSLTIIINFMHILCKPLVHRQDGIDLIRISIIEPFGRQLLIRGSVKHHRGWGGCRACSDLNPTGSPAGNGGQVPKTTHHGADNQLLCFPDQCHRLLWGDTAALEGMQLRAGSDALPSCTLLSHSPANRAHESDRSVFPPKKQLPAQLLAGPSPSSSSFRAGAAPGAAMCFNKPSKMKQQEQSG